MTGNHKMKINFLCVQIVCCVFGVCGDTETSTATKYVLCVCLWIYLLLIAIGGWMWTIIDSVDGLEMFFHFDGGDTKMGFHMCFQRPVY